MTQVKYATCGKCGCEHCFRRVNKGVLPMRYWYCPLCYAFGRGSATWVIE